VATRLPSLLQPPLGFAHRGASAHERENTLEAFRLALRLGATGIESDVWITDDDMAVLDHDGVVRSGLRRRRIRDVARQDLPAHIPTLEELLATCGTAFHLSLDVKDPQAVDEVLAVVRAAGDDLLSRLWLCHPEQERLSEWRRLSPSVRLVNSTRRRAIRDGPERRAAALQSAGIDAINLPETDWSGGLTTLFHRFDRFALGWNAQHDRQLGRLLDMGIDAVYSDHVDRMTDAIRRAVEP
jgi:glycerophosphoryl diester phosphodiesterase